MAKVLLYSLYKAHSMCSYSIVNFNSIVMCSALLFCQAKFMIYNTWCYRLAESFSNGKIFATNKFYKFALHINVVILIQWEPASITRRMMTTASIKNGNHVFRNDPKLTYFP